jgi:uncharacterized FAD-dependent dehydrogenase
MFTIYTCIEITTLSYLTALCCPVSASTLLQSISFVVVMAMSKEMFMDTVTVVGEIYPSGETTGFAHRHTSASIQGWLHVRLTGS